MLRNIHMENAVHSVLKLRFMAVGPFFRNKSHILLKVGHFWTKNAKIQKFHKIYLLEFSEILCNDENSEGSKSDV